MAQRRAAPNTHADSGGPAPWSKAAVPGNTPRPVPILIRSPLRGQSNKRRAHLRQGRGQLGKARDGGGSSGDCSFLGPRSEGGRVDVGMAPRRQARTTGDGLAPISLRPPTCLRAAAGPPRTIKKSGRGRRPFQASGCRGYDQGHTGADSWSNDNGMSSLWLTPSAPVRLRLAGRPAAQCLTKRWISKTSLVWSMW